MVYSQQVGIAEERRTHTPCGWGFENFLAEANTGKGLKVAKWMQGYIKYVLPILTAAFVVIAIATFFA